MSDRRDELIGLDPKLGRVWAKCEIILGLLAVFIGLMFGIASTDGGKGYSSIVFGAAGMFVFGGYLALAGHRSHLYRWNNRNTVTLIDEIRWHGSKDNSQ